MASTIVKDYSKLAGDIPQGFYNTALVEYLCDGRQVWMICEGPHKGKVIVFPAFCPVEPETVH